MVPQRQIVLVNEGMTLAEARISFKIENGLPADGGYAARRWSMRLGDVRVWLPNFKWRQRAVPIHDLHHIVTGLPCTPAGEMQVAAWEFAAGRFPHPYATLFCLPLVAVGAVLHPRLTFAAFVLGRHSRTLYATPITPELLATRVHALRQELLPQGKPNVSWRDICVFAGLVAASVMLICSPAVALLLASTLMR